MLWAQLPTYHTERNGTERDAKRQCRDGNLNVCTHRFQTTRIDYCRWRCYLNGNCMQYMQSVVTTCGGITLLTTADFIGLASEI
eukprot:9425425-Pyramimonas_sp.AAC.2